MSDFSWLDLAQTGVLFGGLLFTAWEFRVRAREQQFRNYLDGIAGFLDISKLMVEMSELHDLYEYSPRKLTRSYEDMSPEERSQVHYCDMVIALCESVWIASKRKWVSRDEWSYWNRWIKDLCGSPYFRWTVEWVEDEYDPQFILELKQLISDYSLSTAGGNAPNDASNQ